MKKSRLSDFSIKLQTSQLKHCLKDRLSEECPNTSNNSGVHLMEVQGDIFGGTLQGYTAHSWIYYKWLTNHKRDGGILLWLPQREQGPCRRRSLFFDTDFVGLMGVPVDATFPRRSFLILGENSCNACFCGCEGGPRERESEITWHFKTTRKQGFKNQKEHQE